MASIRKHRDKYQVQIRRKGVAPLTKTFTLLADAEEWVRHQERLADRGELGPDRKELERITLAELVRRYLNEVVPTKKGADIEKIVLDAFLRNRTCKKRLSELRSADFTTHQEERLKTITTKSLEHQLALLRNMFVIARVDWALPLRAIRLRVFPSR
jgi:hypothetical protein